MLADVTVKEELPCRGHQWIECMKEWKAEYSGGVMSRICTHGFLLKVPGELEVCRFNLLSSET